MRAGWASESLQFSSEKPATIAVKRMTTISCSGIGNLWPLALRFLLTYTPQGCKVTLSPQVKVQL